MKMSFYLVVVTVMTCVAVSGCSTTSESEKDKLAGVTVIPPRGADLAASNGEATTQCVPKTDDIAGDEAEAAALSRAVLAKSNTTRLTNMDEVYKRRTRAEGGVSKGSVFEMTSKQVGERTMKGSRITKVYMVDIDKVSHVCVTVSLRDGVQKASGAH